jgi:hypothetical protein
MGNAMVPDADDNANWTPYDGTHLAAHNCAHSITDTTPFTSGCMTY